MNKIEKNNKVSILFISPTKIIGGMNMKYDIFYKYLPENKVEKYYLSFVEDDTQPCIFDEAGVGTIGRGCLLDFIHQKKIQFLYSGMYIDAEIEHEIKKSCWILRNIVFAKNYTTREKEINCVISRVLYLKIKQQYGPLSPHTYVTYNGCAVDMWTKLYDDTNIKKYVFPGSRAEITLGKIARTEPSKWDFMIIKTIRKLVRMQHYRYNFIFVGMCTLHQKMIQLFLDKQMKQQIIFLPELKDRVELARVYKTMDIYWQVSSFGESFGNTIVEAYAFKKPVLASSTHFEKKGRIIERLDNAQLESVDDGVTGWYVQYPEQVIELLDGLDIHSIQIAGKEGYKKLLARYEAKRVCKSLAHLLHNIALNTTYKLHPSTQECREFQQEYYEKIDGIQYRVNTHLYKQYKRKLWIRNKIEFFYLVIRKLLRKLHIELEINTYSYQ